MRPFAWMIPAVLVLAGCSSTGEVTHDGATLQDQEVRVKEPRTGWPAAPPLGSPRAKLPPDDIVVKERNQKLQDAADDE